MTALKGCHSNEKQAWEATLNSVKSKASRALKDKERQNVLLQRQVWTMALSSNTHCTSYDLTNRYLRSAGCSEERV